MNLRKGSKDPYLQNPAKFDNFKDEKVTVAVAQRKNLLD
jgi:hypothetical protein